MCFCRLHKFYFKFFFFYLQDILAGCKEVTSLSPLSEQVLKRLSPQTVLKSGSCLGSMIPDASTSEDGLNSGSAAVKMLHTFTTTSSTSPLLFTVENKVKVSANMFYSGSILEQGVNIIMEVKSNQ